MADIQIKTGTSADTSGFDQVGRSLGDLAGRSDITRGALMKIGETITSLATESFRKLIGVVTESVDVFARKERATLQVDAALKQMGYSVEKLAPALQAQARAFEDSLGVDDETIQKVQMLLLRFGTAPDMIKPTTQAILDLSATMGKDAVSAAELLVRSIESGSGHIKGAGIVFESTGSKTRDLEIAVQKLEERFGGAAQANADSFSGSIQKLHRSTENLEAAIGKLIATGEREFGVLSKLTSAAKALTDAIDGTDKAQDEFNMLHKGSIEIQNELAVLEAEQRSGQATDNALLEHNIALLREKLHANKELEAQLAVKAGFAEPGDLGPANPRTDDETGKGLKEAKKQMDEWVKEMHDLRQRNYQDADRIDKNHEELNHQNEERQRKNHELLHKLYEEDDKKAEEHRKILAEYWQEIVADEKQALDEAAGTLSIASEEADHYLEHQKEVMKAVTDVSKKAAEELVDAIITGANEGEAAMFRQLAGFLKTQAIQATVQAAVMAATAITDLVFHQYTAAGEAGVAAGEWAAVAALAGGASAGFAAAAGPEKHHDGGWAGESYHDGGFVEVPATLLAGERVLSHREVDRMGGPDAVDRAAAGGPAPLFGKIEIKTWDVAGTRDFLGGAGARALKQARRVGGDITTLFGRR